MKLISMTDFVLDQGLNPLITDTECWIRTHKYAEFLKQPLTLGMFVPCDDQGNVLQEPKTTNIQDANFDIDEVESYQKTKEKVLFKGFEYKKDAAVKNCVWIKDTDTRFHIDIRYGTTVERLVNSKLELTESAIKRFM